MFFGINMILFTCFLSLLAVSTYSYIINYMPQLLVFWYKFIACPKGTSKVGSDMVDATIQLKSCFF